MIQSEKNKNVLALVLITIIGLLFHFNTLDNYPEYIHTWAQSDRFALALNFISNGFDILNAQTFLFNTEFPTNFLIQRESTIVSVNLPIHELVISIIMWLLNTSSPLVFRLYVFCWSCLGTFYLFKLSGFLKLSTSCRYIFIVFAITSPVYVYYQDNFLPSALNLSTVIIGFYYYLRYSDSKRVNFFIAASFFMLLSSIYRTTAIIPFIAILAIEFISLIKSKGNFVTFSLILVISAVILYFHREHNIEQIHIYGSAFLYYLVPASDFNQSLEIIINGTKKWFFDCISPFQLMIILFLFSILRKSQLKRVELKEHNLLLFIVISSLGFFAFWMAMLTKYSDHDYYFLDTFYFPIMLFTLVLFKTSFNNAINKYKTNRISIWLLIVLSVINIGYAYSIQSQRTTGYATNLSTIINHSFQDSDKVLDAIGISKDDTLLVIAPKLPNLPFVHLKRKGLILFTKQKLEFEKGLNWNYDYIVSPTFYIKGIKKKFPTLNKYLIPILSNKKLSVYKIKKESSIKL